jgi:predicted small lipoprotein YifL
VSLRTVKSWIAVSVLAALVAACGKGGNLTLEPGAVKVRAKGSPYVSVVQGAKADLTSGPGVKGWVTVQAVASEDLSSGSHRMIVNKPSAQ